jgi:hypothetical protein
MAMALTRGASRVAARSVSSIASKIDRYFRSGRWWTDRVATGLKHLVNGILTPFPEEAFISLTTSLEAVLGTGSTEITHRLAERVAILLGGHEAARLSPQYSERSESKTIIVSDSGNNLIPGTLKMTVTGAQVPEAVPILSFEASVVLAVLLGGGHPPGAAEKLISSISLVPYSGMQSRRVPKHPKL